jgi:hypothetical protein
MDEPTKLYGPSHRKERHNPNITPSEVEKMFWDKVPEQYRCHIRNAVIDHILRDNDSTEMKERVKKVPKNTSSPIYVPTAGREPLKTRESLNKNQIRFKEPICKRFEVKRQVR